MILKELKHHLINHFILFVVNHLQSKVSDIMYNIAIKHYRTEH